ncbi:helix-turn-helix domain-containing protein [Catellatospora coxensis]
MPKAAYRSRRAELAALRAELTERGTSVARVAAVVRTRFNVNSRVAFRNAVGMTQQQVAEQWNMLWPSDRPLTHKQVSYWEAWPSASGRPPSIEDLNRLARIYQCSAADLLDGDDFTADDAASQAGSEPVGAAVTVAERSLRVQPPTSSAGWTLSSRRLALTWSPTRPTTSGSYTNSSSGHNECNVATSSSGSASPPLPPPQPRFSPGWTLTNEKGPSRRSRRRPESIPRPSTTLRPSSGVACAKTTPSVRQRRWRPRSRSATWCEASCPPHAVPPVTGCCRFTQTFCASRAGSASTSTTTRPRIRTSSRLARPHTRRTTPNSGRWCCAT